MLGLHETCKILATTDCRIWNCCTSWLLLICIEALRSSKKFYNISVARSLVQILGKRVFLETVICKIIGKSKKLAITYTSITFFRGEDAPTKY